MLVLFFILKILSILLPFLPNYFRTYMRMVLLATLILTIGDGFLSGDIVNNIECSEEGGERVRSENPTNISPVNQNTFTPIGSRPLVNTAEVTFGPAHAHPPVPAIIESDLTDSEKDCQKLLKRQKKS